MTNGWLFVVTRNRDLDWRPILAPDFLAESKCDFALVLQTASSAHEEPVICRQIDAGAAGRLTLAFRSRPASNVLGLEVAHDRFSRPIYVVEGVVMQGWTEVDTKAVDALLHDQSKLVTTLVRSFWTQSDEEIPPARSVYMSLVGPAETAGTLRARQLPAERSSEAAESRGGIHRLLTNLLLMIRDTTRSRAPKPAVQASEGPTGNREDV